MHTRIHTPFTLLALLLALLSLPAMAQPTPTTEYQTVTTLTPAIVQTMCHNGLNQFVQVVPAPGPGNLIVADSVVINLQYGGIPYVPDTLSQPRPMSLVFFGADSVLNGTAFLVADFKATQSIVRISQPSPLLSFVTATPFGDVNAALYAVSGGACYKGGNSPIVITVNYHIVPVA